MAVKRNGLGKGLDSLIPNKNEKSRKLLQKLMTERRKRKRY